MTRKSVYLLDYDGTLVRPFSAEPLPGVPGLIRQQREMGVQFAVVTNQAGPVYGQVYGDAKYPTPKRLADQLLAGITACGLIDVPVYLCCAPQLQNQQERRFEDASREIFHQLRPLLDRRYEPTAPVHWFLSWDIYHRKPQPGMLLLACKHFGVEPADAIMVGDREEDFQAAEAAGCRFLSADYWLAQPP